MAGEMTTTRMADRWDNIEILQAITEQYAPDEVADFLAEEGIPPQELALPDGAAAWDAHEILAVLWRWGSEGRRMPDGASVHRPLARRPALVRPGC